MRVGVVVIGQKKDLGLCEQPTLILGLYHFGQELSALGLTLLKIFHNLVLLISTFA